jgi:hypothetical protein
MKLHPQNQCLLGIIWFMIGIANACVPACSQDRLLLPLATRISKMPENCQYRWLSGYELLVVSFDRNRSHYRVYKLDVTTRLSSVCPQLEKLFNGAGE